MPYIDESDENEPLSFLRVNVPIGENVADHYTYDVRKCNVTINGGDGSLLKFVNQGQLDNGNSTYAYRDIVQIILKIMEKVICLFIWEIVVEFTWITNQQ